MQLTVNQIAVQRSSLGVKRYYAQVMKHLAWPSPVLSSSRSSWQGLDRLQELAMLGSRTSILWTPCQRGPLLARHHVVTVHDCISIEHTYAGDWRKPAYLLMAWAILKNAERIVAISHATKSAILRNFPMEESRIVVIQSGRTHVAGALSALPAPPPGQSFVLMVTNALPHKNGSRACLGFAASRAAREGIVLRVVGTLSDAALEDCRRSGVQLELHRHVSDEQLASWYRDCLFLLSPSLDEGHNLPIAEAISHGANVLCSDIPVHREFYNGQALFFDPLHAESIATAIDNALAKDGRWFEAAPTGRTFVDVAADYRALFHSLAQGR
jgi:glycosyltransferase involved in cell wall biosynthesis